MSEILEKFSTFGVVPVVVLNDEKALSENLTYFINTI